MFNSSIFSKNICSTAKYLTRVQPLATLCSIYINRLALTKIHLLLNQLDKLNFSASLMTPLCPQVHVLVDTFTLFMLFKSILSYAVCHKVTLATEQENQMPSATRMAARLLVGAICTCTCFHSTGSVAGNFVILMMVYISLAEVLIYVCLCLKKLLQINKALLSPIKIFSFIKNVIALTSLVFYNYVIYFSKKNIFYIKCIANAFNNAFNILMTLLIFTLYQFYTLIKKLVQQDIVNPAHPEEIAALISQTIGIPVILPEAEQPEIPPAANELITINGVVFRNAMRLLAMPAQAPPAA